MSLSKEFRKPQKEADEAIYVESLVNNKIIAKMFCATGKSLLMRKCKIAQNKKLVVYVFPSLSLIKQFCNDYFDKKDKSVCLLKVSSDESESTTDPVQIIKFLKKNPDKNKIICVTYQSYKTLLDNLGSTKINVCIYDEAHHAVAPKYQKYIFEDETNACEKQLFFTATPKDDNGVVMCDKEAGICGRTVYDYPYYRGLEDGYLNKFEIRVDMYTENTNYSIYESIARTILISGNNRVLTFHADVNTDRDTSVLKFVNQAEFINAFNKVLKEEFPEKVGIYTKFKMIALDASINSENRETILKKFDTTPDNEVYIISSCETIGEGIDTKNANMCVFVDPKSSYVKIIQNIGRIVRPQSKTSTVLIPCWVDKEKYIGCDEDREKCDEVIRADLINDRGNFNGILKVLSALRQEDEDLYEACLYYGEEVDNKINKCSSTEDSSSECSDSVSDSDSEYEEEDELPIKPKIKINVSFHTNDDIKVLWKISSDIDIMKNMCSCVLDCEVEKYDPIEVAIGIVERAKEREINEEHLLPRHIQNKKNRTTPELIQECKDALKLRCWKYALKGKGNWLCYKEAFDYLDENLPDWRTEINLDEKAIEDAKNIVERAKEREKNGLKLLPRHIQNKKKRNTLELKEENSDASKLSEWKKALRGQRGKCSNEVSNYLDKNLPGWRSEIDFNTMAVETAKQIIERANERVKNGGRLLPKQNKKNEDINDELNQDIIEQLKQEKTDANIISRWRMVLNGKSNKESLKCPQEVVELLNKYLPGWHDELNDKSMVFAKQIVKRAKKRILKGDRLLPRAIREEENRNTDELNQENRDALKLGQWKNALKGRGHSKCPDDVRDYLDEQLPGWRSELDEKTMEDAKYIVFRKNQRPNLLPRRIREEKNRNTPALKQEHKDATKLLRLKQALNGKRGICPDDVRDYLDENLPGWRVNDDENIKTNSSSSSSSDVIEEEEIIIIPKKKSMKLTKPSIKKETCEQRRERAKSELSVLHQRYKSLKSENLKNEFQENPELWNKYHAISEENEKSFPEEGIPRNCIIQDLEQIKINRSKKVVDMGCGKAQIADHFANDSRFHFINYDHVSSKENVEVQDISKVPLGENDVEICILCLAMWGSNCEDYIKEAYRILEPGGNLYIIESTKRWTEKDENGIIIAGQAGVKLKKLLEENGFKIVCEDDKKIAKFSYFKCTK
jgi:superfamily II DNA or RNA helicase/SAM-dependent methyltransferase/ribosome modulation factor